MIIDHVRVVLGDMPTDVTTRQVIRAVNRRRMLHGKRPVLRGPVKRALFKLVAKGEVIELAFNRWRVVALRGA